MQCKFITTTNAHVPSPRISKLPSVMVSDWGHRVEHTAAARTTGAHSQSADFDTFLLRSGTCNYTQFNFAGCHKKINKNLNFSKICLRCLVSQTLLTNNRIFKASKQPRAYIHGKTSVSYSRISYCWKCPFILNSILEQLLSLGIALVITE